MGKYNSLPRLFQETSTCENTEQWGLKNDAAQRNVSLKTPSIKPITVELPRPLNPDSWAIWYRRRELGYSSVILVKLVDPFTYCIHWGTVTRSKRKKIIQKPLRSRKYSHHSWMSHWEICIEDFEARSLNLHLLVFV